jgi:hypothetical protein
MLDIDELIKEFPEARISGNSDHLEYYVNCRKPHKKGGIYKMSVNAETGVYYCHDCKAAGNIYTDYLDVTNQFARYRVERMDTRDIVQEARRKNLKIWENEIPTPGDIVNISSLSDDHPAIEYLRKRGIEKDDAEDMKLSYCIKGQFRFCGGLGTTSGRIIFPIYMSGDLHGWQARVIDGSTPKGRRCVWKGEQHGWTFPTKGSDGNWSDFGVPKYYTCPGMKRSSALFNFDQAVQEGKDLVVVTEGPIDCLKVGKRGVATFGSKITNQQIRILKSNWDLVIWILDRDIDTDSTWFNSIAEELADGTDLVYFKLDGGSDPGEMKQSQIWKEIYQKTQRV